MANTVIKIKRSISSAAPVSLNVAEPAYSFNSNKLFLGNTTGDGVIEVGGKYWVDTTVAAFAQANAAYDAANTAGGAAVATAWNTANAAYIQANTARDTANTAATNAVNAYGQANTARDTANTAATDAANAFAKANTAGTDAVNAYGQANTARDTANTAGTDAVNAFGKANTALSTGQSAYGAANLAWSTANSKFSSSGGTINGDVSISGNLTLTGNTTFINVATYKVDDPLIYLAANNYTSDLVDIGFIANYVNATSQNVHTGIFRDAGSKEWYVFEGYDQEPENNVIDPNGNNFTISVLNANIRTSNLILNGIVNAYSWIAGAYTQANTGVSTGQFAYGAANLAWSQANTALSTGQSAFDGANLAWAQANAAYNRANSVWASANSASNINSGILAVNYGGTGNTAFTVNGIVYGNGTGGLLVTTAGTEGQVLQASASGVPQFGMLDGGVF